MRVDGMQRTIIVAEGLGINVQLDRWHSVHLRRPKGARGRAQPIALREPTTNEARPASTVRGWAKHKLDGARAAGHKDARAGKHRPFFAWTRESLDRQWCQKAKVMTCVRG